MQKRAKRYKEVFNIDAVGFDYFFSEKKEYEFYRYKDISIRLDRQVGSKKVSAYTANFKTNTFDLFLVANFNTEEELDKILKFIIESGGQ